MRRRWQPPEPDRLGRARSMARGRHRPSAAARDRRFGNDPGDGAMIRPRSERDAGHAPAHRRWLAGYRRSLSAQRTSGRLTRLSTDTLYNHVRQWVDWLDEQARCDAPDAGHLQRFLTVLARTRSAASQRTMAEAIAHFERWRNRNGATAPPLITDLPGRQATATASLVADRTTVKRLLKLIGRERYADRRLRVVVQLLAAGAEPISLHRADRGDVDLMQHQLRIQPRGHRQKDGVLTFDAATARELRAYLDLLPAHGPLLLNANRAGELPRQPRRLSLLSIRLGVQRLLELAGIVRRDRHGALIDPGTHGTGFLRRQIFTRLAPEQATAAGLAANPAQWRAMVRRCAVARSD